VLVVPFCFDAVRDVPGEWPCRAMACRSGGKPRRGCVPGRGRLGILAYVRTSGAAVLRTARPGSQMAPGADNYLVSARAAHASLRSAAMFAARVTVTVLPQ
jgi:hypothetical protein